MDELYTHPTQTSIMHRESRPINSSLLQSTEYLVKEPTKDKCNKLNNQCILLLKNLIQEQMTHRFDQKIRYNKLDSSNINQFKFFLNSLEILCHYLNVINLSEYRYRLKDYDKLEMYLTDLPRKAEQGTIIIWQTYSLTLQKDISQLLELGFGNNNPQASKQQLLAAYNDYSFRASQYHTKLRNIFKELERLNQIIMKVYSDAGNNAVKDDSIFYVQGIWHPIAKVFYHSPIKQLLEAFELSIRSFEKSYIQMSLVIVEDLLNRRSPPRTSRYRAKEEECFSPIRRMSLLTSVAKEKREVVVDDGTSHNLSKLLDSLQPGAETNFGYNGPRLALSDLAIEKNCEPSISIEKEKIQREFLVKLSSVNKTSRCTIYSPNFDLEDNLDDRMAVTRTTIALDKLNTHREPICTNVTQSTDLKSTKRLKAGRLQKYLTNSQRFRSSTNKENDPLRAMQAKLTERDRDLDQSNNQSQLNSYRESQNNPARRGEMRLKTLFEESKFSKRNLNIVSQLQKFR